MAISQSDLALYKCSLNPTDDSSPLGGSISSNLVTGSVGDVFPILVSNPTGSSAIIRYGKFFLKNISVESLTLNNAAIRISNCLNGVNSPDVAYFKSTSIFDDSTKLIRVIGINSSNQPDWEEVLLSGTSPVVGSKSWLKISRVEVRKYTSARTLVNSSGEITVGLGATGSVVLGYIPINCDYAVGEIDISLGTVLNDSDQVTNALTSPSSAIWVRPQSFTSFPVTSIPVNSAISVWLRVTLQAGIRNTERARIRFEISGD